MRKHRTMLSHLQVDMTEREQFEHNIRLQSNVCQFQKYSIHIYSLWVSTCRTVSNPCFQIQCGKGGKGDKINSQALNRLYCETWQLLLTDKQLAVTR